MTEADAIKLMRDHVAGLFPRSCPKCGHRYESLRQYIQETKPAGATMSYDAEVEDWKPAQPMGTVAMATCRCGTTMSLTSEGMPLLQMWRLLHWARVETKRRGISQHELLTEVRNAIRRQVLEDTEPAKGPGQ